MGRIIRGDIPAFFHGVSRQPSQVRQPGQVEDMLNGMPSVVSGGFEKRPGTRHRMEITGYAAAAAPWFHHYNRDNTEQYIISVEQVTNDGPELRVFDVVNYTEKTVNVSDSTIYYARNQDSTVTVATGTSVRTYKTSGETQIDLDISGVAGGLEVVVQTAPDSSGAPGSWTTRATLTADGASTVTMEDWIRVNVTIAGTGTFTLTGAFKSLDYLFNADPMGLSAQTIADYTVIANNAVTTRLIPDPSAVTTYGPSQSWADLPRVGEAIPAYLDGYDQNADSVWDTGDTGCTDDNIWKVEPEGGTKDAYFWAQLDSSGTVWEWEETSDPNYANSFDAATMPYQLVRQSDGTFTFGPIAWSSRDTGDPTIVPDPDFVGSAIETLTFHRDRLGIVSAETIFFSAQGDYFNMWPLSATQVIDGDPFGVTASAGRISLLKKVVPFRRALFATAGSTQFEISGDNLFTPARAAIDYSTAYDVETTVQPVALGDTLYFLSTSGERTLMYEYFYDDASLSNTANEVTVHVRGYIPDGAKWMTGDPTQTLVQIVVDDGTIEEIYNYSYYWRGREKVQEAWHKWQFQADTEILYMAHLDEPTLTLVLRRTSGEVYVETIDLSTNDITTDDPYNIRLDQRSYLSGGSYNAGNDETTFTLPWEHDDDTNVVAIASNDYAAGIAGRALTVTLSSTNTLVVDGDYSSGIVIVGRKYNHEVELSTIYWRADVQKNITDGRLQLKDMIFDYEDFRDLRGRDANGAPLYAPGTEPLYSFTADVIQLYFSIWF